MFSSHNRRHIADSKEKATFDYLLADLIGKSIARMYGSSNKMPDISEQYPSLFDSVAIQEQRQKKKDELSALRFKLFADSFNKKFKDKEATKIE